MSATGPIGRTPRQVAGPGVGDPEPDADAGANAEPAPGRSVFDTTPEGEEVVASEPGPVVEIEPDPDPDLGEAPAPEPDQLVATEPVPGPAGAGEPAHDDAPHTVETVPAPDPERDIDEDPVFLDDHTTEVAEGPVLTPEEGALDEPTGDAADPPDLDSRFMGDTGDLRDRWEAVQASFVDDPRDAVAQADEMVSAAVAALQARVEQQREDLAETWRSGEQPSTDDLLVAFQRYRDLFDGVLST